MDDKTQALAQELVDFIAGEPKRFEEEQAAKAKSQSASAANRKARLIDEVAKKIGAAMPEEDAPADAGAGAAAPVAPAAPKPAHK